MNYVLILFVFCFAEDPGIFAKSDPYFFFSIDLDPTLLQIKLKSFEKPSKRIISLVRYSFIIWDFYV